MPGSRPHTTLPDARQAPDRRPVGDQRPGLRSRQPPAVSRRTRPSSSSWVSAAMVCGTLRPLPRDSSATDTGRRLYYLQYMLSIGGY